MIYVQYNSITQNPQEFFDGQVSTKNILGNHEAEEMLSRIIKFCLDQDRWVAPSFDELDDQIRSDLQKIAEIRRHNHTRLLDYRARLEKQSFFQKLFRKKPRRPEPEKCPSTIASFDPSAPCRGIHYLLDNQLAKLIEEDDDLFVKATEKALVAIKSWKSIYLQKIGRRHMWSTWFYGFFLFSIFPSLESFRSFHKLW